MQRLEVSGAVRPLYWPFGVKGLMVFPACKINPSNAELNPICYLLALLGSRHIFHVSRIRVKRRTWMIDE